jgi:oxygen-dependent protoporphyrinogen oxidase
VAAIVVVGGGVAGLVCAWRLSRAGHDVEVLEREAEAGGRLRSEREGALEVDDGIRLAVGPSPNLRAVAGALGLGDAFAAAAPPRHAVLRAGRLFEVPTGLLGALASPLLSPRSRARLVRLALDLARQRSRLDPSRPERAAALDRREPASAWRARVGDEAFDCLLAPAFVAAFGAEPEDLSQAFAALALRGASSGPRAPSVADVAGLLARTLAARVAVRSGCEAVAVETETDGATVRYRCGGRERRVFADAAVLAVPAREAARLGVKLTPSERGYLESVRSVRALHVHALVEPPPAPSGALLVPRCEGFDLCAVAVRRRSRAGAGAGRHLVAAFSPAAGARLWDAPDDLVRARAEADLARMPLGRLELVRSVVRRVDPLAPRFGPGHVERLRRFASRIDRSPRLAFAGDHLVAPTLEGALTSGMRAATEVARGLSRAVPVVPRPRTAL